jgi:hypothetical protein
MRKFSRKKYNIFLSLLGLCLFIMGCGANVSKKCFPCPEAPYLAPNINFRVLSKTTGQDLFFGSGAVYKISQLKLNHLVNGIPDSVHLTVDTAGKYFHFFIATIHNTDTVIMNIAGLPQDTFLFKTTNNGGCCSITVFNSVLFDGTQVYTPAGGPNVVVIDK